MNEIDHEHTTNLVCPHCGYEETDSWEISSNDEDLGLIECGSCEKHFYGTRNITINYSTEKAIYGKCNHCKEDDVVIASYWSSMAKYDGLCIECGALEKQKQERAYFDKLLSGGNQND